MDQYPAISIKNPERTNRSAGGAIQIKIQGGSQKCPTQWKKCLCDGMIQTDLAALLGQEWQQPHCRTRFAGIGELYVTHGAECHKLVAGEEGISCSWVDELCTQQEKADMRILLHGGHASSSGLIASSSSHQTPILACTFSHRINARMLFCTGTKQ